MKILNISLPGKIIYFDDHLQTLHLRIKKENENEELIITLLNSKNEILKFQEQFAFNDEVLIKASVIISQKTKKLELIANSIEKIN